MSERLPVPLDGVLTTEYLQQKLGAVRDILCKDATDAELALFIHLSVFHQLDPFLREIWYVPKLRSIMVGRDGFLRLAKRTPGYRGMSSDVVYREDAFTMRWVNGMPEVEHIPNYVNRLEILGAWALVRMAGLKAPIYAWASWAEMSKSAKTRSGADSVWGLHPAAMILKCAEAIALKRAAGAHGLRSGDEPSEVDDGSSMMIAVAADAPAIESHSTTPDSSPKAVLVARILRAENELAAAEWGNWHVRQRRLGSRVKHAGAAQLEDCSPPKLEAYALHLTNLLADLSAHRAAQEPRSIEENGPASPQETMTTSVAPDAPEPKETRDDDDAIPF